MKTKMTKLREGAVNTAALPKVVWNGKAGILIGSEHPHHNRAFCLSDNGRTEYVPWKEVRALDCRAPFPPIWARNSE